MSLTDLRLKKKGQLAELAEKRRTLAEQADILLIAVLTKADTIADAAALDTGKLLQAATDLHATCQQIRTIDKDINQLHTELYG